MKTPHDNAGTVNVYGRALSAHEIKLHYLLEVAWGLIANAGEGDWNKELPEWRKAASKWRDEWREEIDSEQRKSFDK